MADITLREPCLPEDIETLVSQMRAADRDELLALRAKGAGETALRLTIDIALRDSAHAWAAEHDGQLLGLGGVTPWAGRPGIGVPWLLGTHRLNHFPKALTALAKDRVRMMQQRFPHLVNYVDARHTQSIRWLKRLGFTFSDRPIPIGPQAHPCYRFEMRT